MSKLRSLPLFVLAGFCLASSTVMPAAAAEEARTPLYWRDPSGGPHWSAAPKRDAQGRDFLPVYEDAAAAEPSKPKAAPDPTRKILYYRNPMGLPDTSPVPKKDSMGMNYVPVYEGDESDDGTVKLSPGKIQRSGVKSEPVVRRPIHVVVKAPGVITLDERRVSVIAMRSESFVQKVADVTTGTRVRAGQPLMEIYSATIASAAADYLSTIDSKTTAGNVTFGRGSRQRLVNLDVPEPVIAALETTRTAPVTVQWTAPRDGIVLERNAVEGMRANPGDVLFRIADISEVWAVVEVAERDLGAVAIGQPVTVRARAYPGRVFEGVVKVVYPQINRETRTTRVRVELVNADLALLPEMYVDAAIDVAGPGEVLTVPDSAVLDNGSHRVVLVDKGDGRFEPREVKLGRRGDGVIEVSQGVADGEKVVTSANFLIDAESNLKSALKGFEAAAESPDAGSPPANPSHAHAGDHR
ncbi:MAG: efflux RND transporter periplasmic adaptor subunit [Rhodopseudomonas palustris]|uniref:Efflux RND transporter periplasmic adaptor subunit n=1 Tax=Rhodopseudomonas palustris TaxID=1076 RepID=A0A933RWZ9_RHOPL|nr:efflux RND transporter periplasmic adaptor subunit [Rhodopseudomonas palustris]